MKANSIENLLADQKFKIQPADENFSNYLLDCFSPFTCRTEDLQGNSEVSFGASGKLESKIKGRSWGTANL